MVQTIAKDKSEQKTLDDIRKFGHQVTIVGASDEGPQFAYSIGLFETYAHPEIIITGLPFELMHELINDMAENVKNGRTFTSNEFHEGIIANYLCYFGEVPKELYREYVGWAIWYYQGNDFPLIQCVFPAASGKFPWETDFPEEARWEFQMLVEPPKEH